MSIDSLPQDPACDVVSESRVPHRDCQLSQTTIGRVGAPLPRILVDTRLALEMGISLPVFYERKKAGDFTFLELKPQLSGGNTRYSGELVARWLAGENMAGAPSAVKSTRRFFLKSGGDVISGDVIAMPKRRGRRPGRPRKLNHAPESIDAGATYPLKPVEKGASR